MSGYWSIENVEDAEALWVDWESARCVLSPTRETPDGRVECLDAVTGFLIWMLPFVHIEEITTGNVEETFLRIRMLELAQGPLLTEHGEERWITLDSVRRRIGLCVGAGISLEPFEVNLIGALRTRARKALNEANTCA
jgi:hypothetical protein